MIFELVNCFVANRCLRIIEAQIEQKLRSSFSEYRVACHAILNPIALRWRLETLGNSNCELRMSFSFPFPSCRRSEATHLYDANRVDRKLVAGLAYRCNPNGIHQGEVTLLGIRLAAGGSDCPLAHPQTSHLPIIESYGCLLKPYLLISGQIQYVISELVVDLKYKFIQKFSLGLTQDILIGQGSGRQYSR